MFDDVTKRHDVSFYKFLDRVFKSKFDFEAFIFVICPILRLSSARFIKLSSLAEYCQSVSPLYSPVGCPRPGGSEKEEKLLCTLVSSCNCNTVSKV
jgi:hypothetical protein